MSHISKAGTIGRLSSEAAAGQAAELLGPAWSERPDQRFVFPTSKYANDLQKVEFATVKNTYVLLFALNCFLDAWLTDFVTPLYKS